MHELSITQSILDIALRHGETANAKKITDLYIVIGQLSSVVDDSVQFYWDMIAKDTIAAGARLHFNRIKAEFHCEACNHRYVMTQNLVCPECGSSQVQVVSGEQFYLEAIDIRTGENSK